MEVRFSRSEVLYGDKAQKAIGKAKVAICGVGAVGSFAAECLARLGVGNFELFDFDSVAESNINRQIVALTSTIGRPKAEVMAERMNDINPSAEIITHSDFFIDEKSIPEILNCGADVIVDAIDSISSKVALLSACIRSDRQIVSSMGAARKRDPSKIEVSDIFKTVNCPLAAHVRKGLRESGINKAKISCVFSTEIPDKETHVSGGIGSSKVIGSTPLITGIFGIRLAGLALDKILSQSV